MLRRLSETEINGVGMTSQRTRDRLIGRLREKGIRDERVLEVMRRTPRHLFMDEALASRAYEDTALPIGHGQTISQPFVVARMTEALCECLPDKGARVLELGTGSGYQAAILAELVDEVCTIERIGALYERARSLFRQLGLKNVHARHGDGAEGWPEKAPFHGIMLTAAPETVPAVLFEQLVRPGGCVIAPVGGRGGQQLLRYTIDAAGRLEEECLDLVSFVPFLGGQE